MLLRSAIPADRQLVVSIGMTGRYTDKVRASLVSVQTAEFVVRLAFGEGRHAGEQGYGKVSWVLRVQQFTYLINEFAQSYRERRLCDMRRLQ